MSDYSKDLKNGKWQRKRLEIMKRDGFKCRLCSEENELNVHHLYYILGNKPWNHPNNYLITLCEGCHKDEHAIDTTTIALEMLKRIQLLTNKTLWEIRGIYTFADMLSENEWLSKSESFKIHLIDAIKES
jgi:hypothetical protein